MKKLMFFIPAVMFTIFYGLAVLGGMGSIHPIVAVWLVLFWGSGILLSKEIAWGGILGMIPGVCFMYMGTQDTGQIMSETPVGIVVVLYYVVCIYCARKRKKQ